MVEYHTIKVTLSKGQVYKLSKGRKVRLTNSQLKGGDHTLYVTGQQLRRINTRLNKNVGIDIAFDADQLKHNIQHGGSLWDSIKKVGSFMYNNIVKPLGPVAKEVAVDLLRDAAKEGARLAVNTVKDRITKSAASGAGLKRGRKKKGCGWFDSPGDIVDTYKTIDRDVAMPAAEAAIPFVAPELQPLVPVVHQAKGYGVRGRKAKGKGFGFDDFVNVVKQAAPVVKEAIPVIKDAVSIGKDITAMLPKKKEGSGLRGRPRGTGLKVRKQLGMSFRLP